MNHLHQTHKTIVILGAGYGGLMTATRLQKQLKRENARIILVNKNPYHFEATWLHEVSVGTIRENKAMYSIEEVLQKEKVEFVQDTVVRIDKANKKVKLENQTIDYDYLVVALGYEVDTFGIPGLKEHAFALTNINSAIHIKKALEQKVRELKQKSNEILNIVVGGAGFTGIEMLGELANEIPILCGKYNLSPNQIHAICVEAAPSILPGFDRELADYAITSLERKGIEFRVSTAIKEATEKGIKVSKGDKEEFIPSGLMIWAAGVRGSSVIDASEFEHSRNRAKVNSFLQVPGFEDIFVIGDSSLFIDEETNRPLPPTAQVAFQQGVVCAQNIVSLIHGDSSLKKFKFHNKGVVCSLGHKDAIAAALGMKVKGRAASLLKKVVDNRSLFLLGGPSLLLKKGKFNVF